MEFGKLINDQNAGFDNLSVLIVNPEEDFTGTPASYSLFDINYAFKQKVSKYQLQFLFKVENVLDTRYRDYLNRMHYFADEIGRNVSMKVQFIF